MNKLTDFAIDFSIAYDFFSRSMLEEIQCLPLKKTELYLLVAVTDSSDTESISLPIPHKCIEVKKEELEYELLHLDTKKELYDFAMQYEDDTNIDLFLQKLFEFAYSMNASDIHIETLQKDMVFRFRVDGQMVQFFRFGRVLFSTVSSVLKLYSNLDISQKRKPQNGRFSQNIDAKEFDFRVSFMPTITGESIVIRLLNAPKEFASLSSLGFGKYQLEKIAQNINQKQGLILVTGPTGSGKTTTLHSILHRLNNLNKKIITIEDPVEYTIENIQQISINQELGLSYEEVLKNVLRQDPDILLIGEIRDKYALEIALQASLTGHLVLATLHTNDSLSTLNRLLNLGAEPFLIASVLKLIISQRLMQKLCSQCKKIVGDMYEATGCPHCNLLGFKGRTLISEVLDIDSSIASMIENSKSADEISHYIDSQNFISLYDDGYKKVQNGTISYAELLANSGKQNANI